MCPSRPSRGRDSHKQTARLEQPCQSGSELADGTFREGQAAIRVTVSSSRQCSHNQEPKRKIAQI